MLAGQILTDDTHRGIIRSYFYPICLVQDFSVQLDLDVGSFLCDCDLFHSEVIKDRCGWLKSQHFKYQIHHDVLEQENLVAPKIFRLYVEFSRNNHADLYKARWTDGQAGRL